MAETTCDSSLAVTFGTWSYTAKDSKAADTGQYLTVWRRADAGEWRIVLDQSINWPSMPAALPSAGRACDGTPPTLDKLLAVERKLNTGLRNLHVTDSSSIDVTAIAVGSVAGSARADLAVTHGELLDKRAARGSEPQVRAVYVRVWQRDGRSWRVLHEFLTPVTP
jgi:ketosteroid isomerase-like protein